MASLSKSKSISKKQSTPVTTASDELDYDSWDDSWGDDIDEISDWDDDDDWDLDDDIKISTPSRAKSLKKQKQKKSIAQVARTGQLAELQQLLKDMDPDDQVNSVLEHDAKNYSALHYAAQTDNLEMVKLLVQHGADVDDVGEADRRPLHLAAAAKKDQAKVEVARRMSKIPQAEEGVIKFLLSKNADVNAEDSRGRTPLHIATLQGNTEAVYQLLSNSDIELNHADNRNTTPLLLACLHGKSDIAGLLINKGADLTVYDDNGNTPLHISFKEENKRIAKRIIEKGKETGILKDILSETNSDCVAPIHLAVRGGHKDLVQFSLEHVLKADKTDGKDEKDNDSDDDDEEDVINYGGGENDDTPLHEACFAGHLDMAKLLLEKGAKVNLTNWNSETPLHHACIENHQLVAEYLVENGADLNSKDDEDLKPLQVAANHSSFDTIIGVLDRNRNLNTTAASDDQDAASELLKWAAAENKANTLQLLLHHGSKIHGVNDDEIAELIFDAAKKGHTETVATLIRWKRNDVVSKCDEIGNSPLHYASEAGHDITVQELIKAKADVNDCNYDDAQERTPLHLAAANGWIRTAKQLLRAKARVNEKDMYEITPLHLACKNGHIDMVKLLVYEAEADIVLRDKDGLNCLDYAIDNGHKNIANLILSHDKWREVMSVSSLDDDTYEKTTPMRKLIKNMPDVAERVMDKCVKVSPDAGPTDSTFWVEFDYEFLEDSFSHWDRPRDSDDENDDDDDDDDDDEEQEDKDLKDDDDDNDGEDDMKETSFSNKLNGKPASESDIHVTVKENTDKSKSKKIHDPPAAPSGDQYDDLGHLMKSARPYTTSSKDIAANHPLNIMVTSERADLLGHPLVSSLLSHKWSRVGQYFFLSSLAFYLLFVAMLTGYVIVVPPSYYVRFANQSAGVSWFVNGEQRWIGGFHEATLFFFGRIGDWIILILSLINLLREVFQLAVQRRSYFSLGNLIEWSLYILAILLVLPLSDVQYFMGVSIRLGWQWQCGAVAVFLAWINLILFIRRFSGLGIYVIMFIDILRTFMKFVLILILFVVAFALAFYTLLMNQQPFHSVQYSFAKTFVMMIGELDFGDIFHSQNYLRTENTLADSEEDFFLTSVFYEGITYTIFALFLIIMSILIMNLLVGLAVDDIHAIQNKAKLHRLAMQVELVMEVQRALPIFIWRSAVIKFKRFHLNRSCCSGLQKWYRTLTGDQNLLRQAIEVCNKTTTQGEFMHEEVNTDLLFSNIKYRLKLINTKVEMVSEKVEEDSSKMTQIGGEMSQIHVEQKQIKERFDRLEKKIDALLNHNKVILDDESKK
ncbi:transient receptor potential cation channel subfamily A member 1 homolog [Lytechinus pictus]|uniref:transient receptor potential cation channel subfamily A member 1 homolog n=1 Tax=Lytechinus pictus TaxID=7653 RepID=UPI0030BA1EB1